MEPEKRNVTIDAVRTFALFLMVVFHFIYDLRAFGYHNWDIPDGQGWKQFRELIVSLFLFCVGVSLVYAHSAYIRWKSFLLRLGQITAGAIIVSVATYLIAPTTWIYFGILHFIAAGSLISLTMIRTPRIALLAALILLVATFFGYATPRWPYYELFPALPQHPSDFVPLIPWLALVWIGIAAGHNRWLASDPLRNLRYQRSVSMLGKHALIIYLLHQPILIGILLLVGQATDHSRFTI